jgi:hypothetical protein
MLWNYTPAGPQPKPDSRELSATAMTDPCHGARFSVSQMKDGPWLVVDDRHGKRLVASCPNMDAALMVAAIMNGNAEAAMERRKAVIAALDRCPHE